MNENGASRVAEDNPLVELARESARLKERRQNFFDTIDKIFADLTQLGDAVDNESLRTKINDYKLKLNTVFQTKFPAVIETINAIDHWLECYNAKVNSATNAIDSAISSL